MPLKKTFMQICDEARAGITELSTAEVEQAIAAEKPPVLIDVREQDEYRAGHIPGAWGIGRGILEYHIADEVPDTDQEIIVYCRGGNRGALAAASLQEMGYTNVRNMAGGYRKWKEEDRAETTEGEPIVH